ncbi:hypothetical protein EAS64_33750 [Trebonia kvetii]|uniref:Uncharacterized protein n=1 Tax=Trebonia kvetii TaxID=2480626 RepID=A0A6P2BSP4_9ACTN|nr:hypothetical protein [Trebonia kvetii]TVZ01246.1 hypothetical protein EAS64_33750 [Trebonia kvetii]
MDLYRITKTDPHTPHKSYTRIGNKTRARAIQREVVSINRQRSRYNRDHGQSYPLVEIKVERVTVPDDWKDVTQEFTLSLPVRLGPATSPAGPFPCQ